jgi:hypothetical protein
VNPSTGSFSQQQQMMLFNRELEILSPVNYLNLSSSPVNPGVFILNALMYHLKIIPFI